MLKNYKLYQFARPFVKCYFMTTMKPQIINEEVIPKEGPIIFVGNHLNALDQMPVICATNRTIRWMAKKEYFDGPFGFIFKKAGCISVDRKNNTAPALLEAIHYLKEGGAIGIFPEGTRNKYELSKIKIEKIENEIATLKEQSPKKYLEKLNKLLTELDAAKRLFEKIKQDQIDNNIEYNEDEMLAPFSKGVAFMAKKTNATIIPFAITGDFEKGNNNLILRFMEPLKMKNESPEEVNTIIRAQISNAMKENKKQRVKKIGGRHGI